MSSSRQKKRLRIPRLDLRGFFALVLESGRAWNEHRAPRMGAALAYYTAFSLAPLVVFVLSVATLVVKKKEADGAIVDEVRRLMGDNAAEAVHDILHHATSVPALSWSTALSFVLLLIGASGAFGELQDSLNEIWGVPPRKHPLLAMLKERALSLAMIFIVGFLLLLSVIAKAAGGAILGHDSFFSVNAVADPVISFFAFCVIFRVLPDVPLKWTDVWPGALFSSILFLVGKIVLGWYVSFASTSFSRYGAAGSFVVILVWVFYSAQIFLMGAEFSRAYTLKYGSHRTGASPSKKER